MLEPNAIVKEYEGKISYRYAIFRQFEALQNNNEWYFSYLCIKKCVYSHFIDAPNLPMSTNFGYEHFIYKKHSLV